MKKYLPVIVISLLLFIIPFFWLKPGEMDLGGDNTRLYYYDPVSFIKYLGLYNISQVGKGVIIPEYFYLPYVGILAFLKQFLSSTILIDMSNGLKLSVGFASMSMIVYELIGGGNNKKQTNWYAMVASVLAGLFYIFSFGSIKMAFFWDRALITHSQIFLNPLMFYLLLKYMITQQGTYLWISILISFIFSPNFSPISAPPLFSFYPLAGTYIYVYTKFIDNWRRINYRMILHGLVLFLGVQAFHLFGETVNVLDRSSIVNAKIFDSNEILAGGLGYFTAISGSGKAILSYLLPSEYRILQLISWVAPVVIITGFLFNSIVRKKYLLTAVFFFITFFFVTANITHVGFEFYRTLFYIPGFSMFRIFFEKWAFVYIFFYAILFGLGSYVLLTNLKILYRRIFILMTVLLFVISATPFLLGWPVNKIIIGGSKNIPSVIQFDSKYEETLQYIRNLPTDGKFLVFPLTDYFRQLIYGKHGGVYEGPSTISFLTDKYSFVGYQDFGYQKNDPAPYAELIMKYSREKDYQRLQRIFNTLNIRYIFHNSDPRIYEETYYPGGDYSYMRTSLPKTQLEYEEFIQKFPVKEIYKNGSYKIYEMDDSEYNPIVYIPQGIYVSDKVLYDKDKSHWAFVSGAVCSTEVMKGICDNYFVSPAAKISTIMINPTLYEVTVSNYTFGDPLFLILQNTYSPDWKLKLNSKIRDDLLHIPANRYANGWFIPGKDLPNTDTFSFSIVLDSQKYFRYGSIITIFSLGAVIVYLINSLRSKYE